MKTKIEIKSIFGRVLFSYEKENNTVKDTLEEAVMSNANLGGADLGNAFLSGADLRNADLGGADLRNWGKLCSCSDILCVSPIGSRNGCTTIFHTNKGIFVQCGCFKGTLDEFAEKVKETHGDNEHARNYLALVDFVKIKYNMKD